MKVVKQIRQQNIELTQNCSPDIKILQSKTTLICLFFDRLSKGNERFRAYSKDS